MTMQDQLRAKFLKQFMETASQRVTTCQKAVSEDKAEVAASEMHSLAGECSILGFDDMGATAREAEAEAKKWLGGASAGRVKCGRSLRLISRALEAIEGTATPKPQSPEPTTKPATNENVLIIDDSEIVVAHMQESLEDAGLRVHSTDAQEPALKLASQESPSVILVDANIPGVDTRELIEVLRKTSSSSKILLVSGLDSNDLQELTDSLKLDGFVSKQEGVDAVVAGVLETLRGKGA